MAHLRLGQEPVAGQGDEALVSRISPGPGLDTLLFGLSNGGGEGPDLSTQHAPRILEVLACTLALPGLLLESLELGQDSFVLDSGGGLKGVQPDLGVLGLPP